MRSAQYQSLLNWYAYAWRRKVPQPMSICRILHDRESSNIRGDGQFPYLSRFYNQKLTNPPGKGLPEPVRFHGGLGIVKLATQWQAFSEAHAGIGPRNAVTEADTLANQKASHYLQRQNSGWVNQAPWPTVVQVGFGGAYVVVTYIEGDHALIQSYDNSRTPSDYTNVDYLQLFSVAYPDDSIGLTDFPVYSFAIHNPKDPPLWMDVRDLTFERYLQ